MSINLTDNKTFGVDNVDPSIYHCRSGVTLKLKAVSSLLIAKRSEQIPEPIPPTVVDDHGREEPYYGAPSYQQAVREYNEKISFMNMGTMFLLGTEVIDLPPNFPSAESPVWSDPLESTDIWGDTAMKIPSDKEGRYIYWISYIVLNHDIELMEVSAQIKILGGAVPESAVKEAQDSFRGISGERTNTGMATTNGEQRGPNRAARRAAKSSK